MQIKSNNTGKTIWDIVKTGWDALTDTSFDVDIVLKMFGLDFSTDANRIRENIEKSWDRMGWNPRADMTVNAVPGSGFDGADRASSSHWGSVGGGAGRNAPHWAIRVDDASVTVDPTWDSTTNGANLNAWMKKNKLSDSVSTFVNLVRNSNWWTDVANWVDKNEYNKNPVNILVELLRDSTKWWNIADWAERNGYSNNPVSLVVELLRDVNKWWNVADWVERNEYNKNPIGQSVNLDRNGWWNIANWIENNGYNSNPVYQPVQLSIDYARYKRELDSLSTYVAPSYLHAKGGVETPRGGWSFANGGVINAYAGGTNNAHGTMFVAGEAGPEIVGHIGGRTEILNRSQLASTMFAAVRSAMTGVRIDANFYDEQSDGVTQEDMNALLELVRMGSEAVQKQNDLLKQQNDYLNQINNKEFSAEITTSGINRAQARANRRAGIVVAPVGT